MTRIDAHQHFWHFDAQRDTWITPEMQVLRRNWLPNDLRPHLQAAKLDGCVAVQADQSINETHFLLRQAQAHSFVKGVVGWVDLLQADISKDLDILSVHPLLRGFRHIVQAEPKGFLRQANFIKNVRQLGARGYTYDLLIKAHQLPEAVEFVRAVGQQTPIVIDHFAKPSFKAEDFEIWRKHMTLLAEQANVFVKVSGLVTEAFNYDWKSIDYQAYMDHCLANFGSQRIMYGSDWPVCLLAAEYQEVFGLCKQLTAKLSASEQAAIMGQTAIGFYGVR